MAPKSRKMTPKSFQEPSWSLLDRSGGILGRSWRILGRSWGLLGRSGADLGRLRTILGRSWRLLGPLGADLGVPRTRGIIATLLGAGGRRLQPRPPYYLLQQVTELFSFAKSFRMKVYEYRLQHATVAAQGAADLERAARSDRRPLRGFADIM